MPSSPTAAKDDLADRKSAVMGCDEHQMLWLLLVVAQTHEDTEKLATIMDCKCWQQQQQQHPENLLLPPFSLHCLILESIPYNKTSQLSQPLTKLRTAILIDG